LFITFFYLDAHKFTYRLPWLANFARYFTSFRTACGTIPRCATCLYRYRSVSKKLKNELCSLQRYQKNGDRLRFI